MRALHNSMVGFGLAVVLMVSVGAFLSWTPVAEAQSGQHPEPQHGQPAEGQHGQMSDAQEHFHMFAEQLGLTDEQQHSIAEPFHEATAAMETLHQAHDAIVEHLTDEQKQKMAEMIHEMLGAQFSGEAHGSGTLHEGH